MSARGSPTWARARRPAVTFAIPAPSPSAPMTRSTIAWSRAGSAPGPAGRSAEALAASTSAGGFAGRAPPEADSRRGAGQHPDQRADPHAASQRDQVVGDRALGQVDHRYLATGRQPGRGNHGE